MEKELIRAGMVALFDEFRLSPKARVRFVKRMARELGAHKVARLVPRPEARRAAAAWLQENLEDLLE